MEWIMTKDIAEIIPKFMLYNLDYLKLVIIFTQNKLYGKQT